MKLIKIILTIFMIICTYTFSYSETVVKNKQTPIIDKILSMQNNKNTFNNAADIINYIDEVYGGLYDSLEKDGKITIYFGPAHGKDHTSRWRGITTNRIGTTGLPEEYYSIQYSRKLYKLLKENPFFNIAASDEYREALEGKSDSYHYMKFKDVMTNAKNAGAFMVIEMHMNNVSIFSKADGLVNMPGIHMARDGHGRKLLINITGSYSGFLTLYNKFDAGGFSKQYALNIRDNLVAKGYKANSWEYGAVADDRFTYYLLFPVSIIYECGFISHPDEDKKLLSESYMDGMVASQYEMLLKTFNDIYGINISKKTFSGKKKDFKANIELLKLARLALYFIKQGDTKSANTAVNAMNSLYLNPQTKDSINYYNSIINKINKAENYYASGVNYRNKKKFNKARTSFMQGKATLNNTDLYSTYRDKFNKAISGNKRIRSKSDTDTALASTKDNTSSDIKSVSANTTAKNSNTVISVKSSSLTKPFIMTLRDEKNIEAAIMESLAPDSKSLKIITDSMKNYKSVSYTKIKTYSAKKKKYITTTNKIVKDFEFKPGIFIAELNKDMKIVKVSRVSSVYLDPNKYQNHQYLKNSYFTQIEMEKEI
ncbi:MAG: N-acetylmuramoyl-L-alanine amidase [Leptospirales bacterium]|nr:N-acetylmuramoyl-L-alanine amidase [Leptospirales bacterium]